MSVASTAQVLAEAFAFRQLVGHLQQRPDVQNIDLMILAGFCRNCLSKWYVQGARQHGLPLEYEDGNQVVYGMPYAQWKRDHQTPASPEQLAAFEQTKARHAAHAPLPPVNPAVAPTSHAPPATAPPPPPPAPGAAGLSNVCCADLPPPPPAPTLVPDVPGVNFRVGILTVSDRAAGGLYEDLSGPEVRHQLERFAAEAKWTLEVARTAVVPDEVVEIQSALTAWSASPTGGDPGPCNLILTTGGTGFAPRDVTPEATRAIVDKLATGLMTFLLVESLKLEPLALLSRSVIGVRHRTLIVNLPGKPRAVAQNLSILLPLLGHAVWQVDAPGPSAPP